MLNDDVTYAPLKLFEYDHKPGSYALMLTDSDMVKVDQAFAAGGRDGHGYGWADVALGAIRAQNPGLEQRLGMDPEAGMFVAYSEDLEALRALGVILKALFHDQAALAEAAKNAPWEYD